MNFPGEKVVEEEEQFLTLPLSPSWKNLANERRDHPLPESIELPSPQKIGYALLKPCKKLLNNIKVYRTALEDTVKYKDSILKEWRRPFMHSVTVHEVCSKSKEAPEVLREFVHECGQLNDHLRQNSFKNEKQLVNSTDRLWRAIKDVKEEEESILTFDPAKRSSLLKRIEKRRKSIHKRCTDPKRVFTPHQFHALRYDIRQLMYLHRGAWKATEVDTPEASTHFRVFLHLMQLNERMGELNDHLVDSDDQDPLFLTPLDRQDILNYLAIEIQ